MSDDPTPDQTLPEDLDDDGNPRPVEPNQDLPSEKQPPRGRDQNRGRSEDAPGKNKP